MLGERTYSKRSSLAARVVSFFAQRYGPIYDHGIDASYQIIGSFACLAWLLAMIWPILKIVRIPNASDPFSGSLVIGTLVVGSFLLIEFLRFIRSRYR